MKFPNESAEYRAARDKLLEGQARHVDLLWPLWNVLDLTPEGRGKSWYPALEYA
ncbi:MAG: hypothetical protein ACYCW6_24365 [Candidatus Xenobia bacterium]